jgi:hypothetical protein
VTLRSIRSRVGRLEARLPPDEESYARARYEYLGRKRGTQGDKSFTLGERLEDRLLFARFFPLPSFRPTDPEKLKKWMDAWMENYRLLRLELKRNPAKYAISAQDYEGEDPLLEIYRQRERARALCDQEVKKKDGSTG